MESASRLTSYDEPDDPRAELRRLVDALEEGVVLLEAGHVVGVNPALARAVGAGADELVGRPLTDLLADSEGRPLRGLESLPACRLRSVRGDLVPVSIRRVGERILLVVDRSRERRLEGEVWRLAARLRGLASPPAEEERGPEFFGMIEHEIRTATTVIQGYTRMLLDERVGPINSTQHGFLLETRRAAARISALVDNLLELASLDGSAELRIARKPVAIHEVVRSAVEGMRPLLAERALRVAVELAAESDDVRGDAERLEQVVLNLLSNAAKFSPDGSEIRIQTDLLEEAGRASLCLSIADQGPGVRADECERIFEPFVQGTAAAEAGTHGVGLGLSICRKIAAAHGGGVEAVPSLGHGLFRLLLPLG